MTQRYFQSTKSDLLTGSAFALRLSQPQAIALEAGNRTQLWFPLRKHPDRDEWIATFDDAEILPISDLISSQIVDIEEENLKFFYPNLAEREQKQEKLLNSTQLVLGDLIPDRWVEFSYNELSADGWFPVDDI